MKKSQKINFILKRDNSIVDFNSDKIVTAVTKALKESGEFKQSIAQNVAQKVVERVEAEYTEEGHIPSVESIQDTVEIVLMESDLHLTAKAYILYRSQRAELRKKDIFKKRVTLKPYEYPELLEYVDGIRHSYWLHSEFNFTSDIHDYMTNINDVERSALKNAMLAIAQIEVSVKTFWGDIYKKIPIPEIGSVGATFAESEVRHMDAYANLLDLLGLNHEFENIKNIPAIMDRVNYIEKAIAHSRSDDNQDYSKTLLLFSLFIEHVSLFSQFLIIMSFNKHKSMFRGMSNVIEATSKEEQIHGLFGIDLMKIIKHENPTWFDADYEQSVIDICKEAYAAEEKIIDWIYEKGELDFMPKATVKEFVKNRFNNSLKSLGFKKIFETDAKLLEQTEWFDDEIMTTKHGDFFVKRSVNYNKRVGSITGDDLF
ncbi:ribonucleotide-diphosphate reductase subunit beta [Arenimonas sp.]|nr:ribonucleotide-diphosphate reductase subunit beta [Candidatus Parcubacteria bacterium]